MQNSQMYGKPLVSFIITYYDIPVDMLAECIGSILALSLPKTEREIIVVDDGSENCPLDGLKDYRNDIIYIRTENCGLSSARNAGIETSKGKYVQFVDGDDALVPTPYEHCLDIIRCDAETDMVLFGSTQKPSPQTVFRNSLPENGTSYIRNNNLRATAWGYLFKRSILGELRFFPGILHEDEEFTPQLVLRADKVICTDAKAYLYRKREDSITTKKDMRHILKRLNDTEQVIFRLNDLSGEMPHDRHIALQRRVHQLTMDYIYNIMMLTRSSQQLEKRTRKLRERGLFPLPKHGYTTKYNLFRILTGNRMARNTLLRILPLISSE